MDIHSKPLTMLFFFVEYLLLYISTNYPGASNMDSLKKIQRWAQWFFTGYYLFGKIFQMFRRHVHAKFSKCYESLAFIFALHFRQC